MKIRSVVFDFDGTLVDSNAIKRQMFFETTSSLGNISDIVEQILKKESGDRNVVFREIVSVLKKQNRLPSLHSEEKWIADLVSK